MNDSQESLQSSARTEPYLRDEQDSNLSSSEEVVPTAPVFRDHRKKSLKKHWKTHENKRYIEFLLNYGELWEQDRESKRQLKVNKKMSEFIKTKNSTQCRSHHQKMMQHYGNIEGIILGLTNELDQQEPQKG